MLGATMPDEKNANNPLHGVTLEMMLVHLEKVLGWGKMLNAVDIRCFRFDPNIKSSLVFLRRTPWARAEVEKLYLKHRRDVPYPDWVKAARAKPRPAAAKTPLRRPPRPKP
jgi:uncharacterized protein (DUF2132 family)